MEDSVWSRLGSINDTDTNWISQSAPSLQACNNPHERGHSSSRLLKAQLCAPQRLIDSPLLYLTV